MIGKLGLGGMARIEKKRRLIVLAPVYGIVHVPRKHQQGSIAFDGRIQIRITAVTAGGTCRYQPPGWSGVHDPNVGFAPFGRVAQPTFRMEVPFICTRWPSTQTLGFAIYRSQ